MRVRVSGSQYGVRASSGFAPAGKTAARLSTPSKLVSSPGSRAPLRFTSSLTVSKMRFDCPPRGSLG
jgi:hypothetical protein